LGHDGPVRALRPPVAALLGAATLTGAVLVGVLLGAPPAVSAPGDPTLTVAPNHGRATAMFVAQYRFTPAGTQQGPRAACPSVQFQWDGSPLGQPVRSARQGGSGVCAATLRARPPARGRAAGPHQVGVAGGAGRKAQAVGYTIEGAVSATPTRATPTPTVHRGTGTPQADPTDAGAFTPSDLAAPVTVPSQSVLMAVGPAARGGGSATPWIMIFGGILVLGGVAIFGFLIFRSRREEPDLGFDPDPGGSYE
jgi:hypothetical protein